MSDATTASRVFLLAVPRHVTLRAERKPNAVSPGHHYVITGYFPQGEPAFSPDQFVVSESEAKTAGEAVRVALGRFRERGWVAKVERTAEVEADLARVGEAMRDERRRRLLVVADLDRVRRAVENCGDRAAIMEMKAAIHNAMDPDVAGDSDA